MSAKPVGYKKTFFLLFLLLLTACVAPATPASFGDEVLASAMMFLFALCFSLIAAWSRKNQWAILLAGFFASLGLVLTLEILIRQSEATGYFYRLQVLIPKMEILIPKSQVPGLVFMFLLASTFLVFAILSKNNWWAIIPAGLFASIGLAAALDTLIPHEAYPRIQGMLTWGVYTWVLFLGLAATFGSSGCFTGPCPPAGPFTRPWASWPWQCYSSSKARASRNTGWRRRCWSLV